MIENNWGGIKELNQVLIRDTILYIELYITISLIQLFVLLRESGKYKYIFICGCNQFLLFDLGRNCSVVWIM